MAKFDHPIADYLIHDAKTLLIVADYLFNETWRLGRDSLTGKDCLGAAQHVVQEAAVLLGKQHNETVFTLGLEKGKEDSDIPF